MAATVRVLPAQLRAAGVLAGALLGVATCLCEADAGTADFPALRAHALEFAEQQLEVTYAQAQAQNRFPRSTTASGAWSFRTASNWVSGFFPGCLWLIGEATRDETWYDRARTWTAKLESQSDVTTTHDVGFQIWCSYGNGYRLIGDPAYPEVIRQAAQSLATRFSPLVGCTRSWDNRNFPVIIDNMMNLELLYAGTTLGGSATWRDMAISHGLRTRMDHVRADSTTYHLVDYDPDTGEVLGKETVQGYDVESTWARGQAWGLYGFAMSYRESGDSRFLETAMALADAFISRLPDDAVPYWDFEAPDIPDEEKDSSAGAIAASGLLELSTLVPDGMDRTRYVSAALEILESLCGPGYLAEGSPSRGILLHAVGNRPAGTEVDVSLIYGDYYFLQALLRSFEVTTDVGPRRELEHLALAASPNPSRGRVQIEFTLPHAASYSLEVLDVRGARVQSLGRGSLPAGTHRRTWDGGAQTAAGAPPGIYFIVLRTDGASRVAKLVRVD